MHSVYMKSNTPCMMYVNVERREQAMQIAKNEVQALLDELPETCEIEELQYRLYVLEKIKRGQASYQLNGGVSQADAEQRLDKWIIS